MSMDGQPQLKTDLESKKGERVVDVVPDGGVKAWCTVAGGWLALFATFGYSNSFGVYQDFYTRSGTSSASNISWIGSIQLFFFFSMGLPAGKLLDKGYFRHVMLIGSFIYVFCLFMLSLAQPDHYWRILLSQGVGMGIGSGLIYLPALTVQAHHWRTRRALAMGFVVTGSSVGGIIYPILLNQLFHGSVGFAWGVRASAFLTLALLVVSNCLMSTRFPPKNPLETAKPKPRDPLIDAPYVLVNIGIFLLIWGLYFPYFYLQLFTILHGLPVNFAFYTLTITSAASILGRTLPNVVADKLGVLNVLIAVTFGTGVMVFAMLGVTSVGHVVMFAILFGFFSGSVLGLLGAVQASLTTDVNQLGIRMGIGFFFQSFAFLTGTPIDGALLGQEFSWWKPIVFSGTMLVVSVPFFIVARSMLTARRKTQRV